MAKQGEVPEAQGAPSPGEPPPVPLAGGSRQVCSGGCAPAGVSSQVCPSPWSPTGVSRQVHPEFLWAEQAELACWAPVAPKPPPPPSPEATAAALPLALPPWGADPDPTRASHVPAGGLTKGEEGREKSRRFVLSPADSGASDCQARLAVFNHFISVLGSLGRQPVLSSLLRKTSGRVAQRRLQAPIISCALRSALRSLPGEPVKN